MPRIDILREARVQRSARVIQLESLFDVPSVDTSQERWSFELNLPEHWSIGVIVGPSGSGKSTLASELFSHELVRDFAWDAQAAVVDGFSRQLSIKDITELLSSVGFSSPPAWLRPYHVLSTGQRFRVDMARALAEMPELCVMDEFTSVVDRTVAQIGSAAIARTVRSRKQRFVAVTCHYDVINWLQPDWVIEMPTGALTRRDLQRRPPVELRIVPVDTSAWELFRAHHYLSHDINRAARCFVALVSGRPVAFNAVLAFPHPSAPGWRSHRTVCLPDYQGLGIGSRLQEFVASMYAATGRPFRTVTSHPTFIRSRQRSRHWRLVRLPGCSTYSTASRGAKSRSMSRTAAADRYSATFEYVGPVNAEAAARFGVLR